MKIVKCGLFLCGVYCETAMISPSAMVFVDGVGLPPEISQDKCTRYLLHACEKVARTSVIMTEHTHVDREIIKYFELITQDLSQYNGAPVSASGNSFNCINNLCTNRLLEVIHAKNQNNLSAISIA